MMIGLEVAAGISWPPSGKETAAMDWLAIGTVLAALLFGLAMILLEEPEDDGSDGFIRTHF